MGLLTTYSKANRVVDTDTVVIYAKERIYGSWSWQTSPTAVDTLHEAWEYRRFRDKSYRYVGMDRSTAEACAAAATTYYTRATQNSVWNSSGSTAGTFTDSSGGNVVMADITIQHRGACMYDVVINVREEDAKLRISSVTPSTLFTTENQRGYDTGDTAFSA